MDQGIAASDGSTRKRARPRRSTSVGQRMHTPLRALSACKSERNALAHNQEVTRVVARRLHHIPAALPETERHFAQRTRSTDRTRRVADTAVLAPPHHWRRGHRRTEHRGTCNGSRRLVSRPPPHQPTAAAGAAPSATPPPPTAAPRSRARCLSAASSMRCRRASTWAEVGRADGSCSQHARTSRA